MDFSITSDVIIITDKTVPAECKELSSEQFKLHSKVADGLPADVKKYAVNIDVLYPSTATDVIQYTSTNNINRLMLAIHEAYDKHLSVELTIDDFWTMICFGWITHIKSNPEKYRSKFVKHSGVKSINASGDNFVLYSPENDWKTVVGQFRNLLYDDLTDMMYNSIICNFMSTLTLSADNSTIAMMNLLGSYCEYSVTTNCGIKSIILRGAKSDWQRITYRIKDLAKYDLEWWSGPLLSVVQRIISTFDVGTMSAGHRENLGRFWQKIYCWKANSSRNVVGWINVFFPFVLTPSNELSRNQMVWYWESAISLDGTGNNLDRFPLNICVVPVIHMISNTQYDVEFVSGTLYATYSKSITEQNIVIRDVVKPQMGYAIRRPS